MRSGFDDDLLELLWLNITLALLIEVQECLTNPLTLQAAQHLRELRIGHGMSVLFVSDVQLRPGTVPVECDSRLVTCISLFKFLEINEASSWISEQTESDLVLGIGLQEKVLNDTPVG